MSRKFLPLSVTAALMGSTAMGDVPNVAADIAPVHSLVARVMEGLGTPNLIIQAGASPHDYNLRPSEAAALQDADLVFWMGEDLTPWMEGAIETLADDAVVTALLEAEGTILFDFREGALFDAHVHKEEGEHAHEEEHDHEEHAHEDEHDDRARDEHGHAHGGHDSHAWLSPENASTWLNLIAAQLSSADPGNAGTYFANAAAARAELEVLVSEVHGILEPVREGRFIVFHDAYQYFEVSFGLQASGAISLGDASDPSPARIAEIQDLIRDEGIECVLAEPQFNRGLVLIVMDGTDANTGTLDPIGSNLEPGPALYPQLIRNLATTLAECL
ncbi:MAG: zinc ABC transporter substrate-binding protein [Rhodobacteraceae bacterium]|nr:zinc ABC transporter substrate-binding protein [Paracoccaceae bacterium]